MKESGRILRDDIPFIRSIAESPEDDAPRLIYSDFLEEKGTEECGARAEFIRVQVERARLDPRSTRWNELWWRDGELLSWAKIWRWEVPAVVGVHFGGFIRGFIDTVQVRDCSSFIEHASEVFDRVPVRKLGLWHAQNSELFALVQERGLQRVRELSLTVELPATEGLRALLDLGPWPNLGKLLIRFHQDPDPGHRLILSKLRHRFDERIVD